MDMKETAALIDKGAGKGPDPRPVVRKKWDSCPLWKNIGPEARKKRDKTVNEKKGFTLIELLVVLSIISIFIALLVPAIAELSGKESRREDG